jgi:hypothetical protein
VKLKEAKEAVGKGEEKREAEKHDLVEGSRMTETGLDERGESTFPSPQTDTVRLPSSTTILTSEPESIVLPSEATPTANSFALAPPLPANNLVISTADSVVSSPQTSLTTSTTSPTTLQSSVTAPPTSPTSPGAPKRSLPPDNAVSDSASPRAGRTRVGSVSGESVWAYESEESSDEDYSIGDGFMTPEEGLSEVGEEEEEEESDPDSDIPPSRQHAIPSSSAAAAPTATIVQTHPDPSSTPATSSQIPPPSHSSLSKTERAPQADLLSASQKRDAKGLLIPATQSKAVEVAPIPHTVTREAADKTRQAEWLEADLAMAHRVMNMFLSSEISEAERIIKEGDAKRERLYYQGGDAILCTLKGMMTFEPADLQHALAVAKHTTDLAAALRKPQSSMSSRLSGLVKGGGGGSINHIKAMSDVEKHVSRSPFDPCSTECE